ncbi:MAG: hypothetical protein AAGD32_05975 [Planctomycetota bacterium]
MRQRNGAKRHDIVVVSCIESGSLEAKTVRLFAALRKWGGELGGARLLAAKCRKGSPLRRETIAALGEVDATFVDLPRSPADGGNAWYQFTNKMVALEHAEQLPGVEQIVFLDADVLPMSSPAGIPLPDDIDFTAAAPDEGIIGSHGPDHPADARWATACHLAGIDLADLPMIRHWAGDTPIRFYINTGVFAYRARFELGRKWGTLVRAMLDAKLSFGRSGEQWLEQSSLGLLVIRDGLRWRLLGEGDNCCAFGHAPDSFLPERLRTARLLHYHDLLNEPASSPLLPVMREIGRGDVADWLSTQTPTPSAGMSSRTRKAARALQRRRYRKSARRQERRHGATTGALGRTDAPTTVVSCVEAGPLEQQAVRLARSLRRHGGALADLPLVMVRPRAGAPLLKSTTEQLAAESVTLIDRPRIGRWDWYDTYNKLVALQTVERYAATPTVTLVDTDILFCREPREILLGDGEDIRMCAPDDGMIGSAGSGHPHDHTWRRLCEVLGVEFDSLGFVEPEDGTQAIRTYYNSGVITCRTALRFSQAWREAVDAVLAARVGFAGWGEWFTDQAVLAPLATKLGLRVGALPMSANFCFGTDWPADRHAAQADAALLHYHKWQHRSKWDRFAAVISEQHPEIAEWLVPMGPVDAGRRMGLIGTALRYSRAVRRRRYRRVFAEPVDPPTPTQPVLPTTA